TLRAASCAARRSLSADRARSKTSAAGRTATRKVSTGHADFTIRQQRATMLRITRVASSDSVPTLKVEGKLVGPWVEELRQVCTELTEAAGPLCLDLSAVSFVDAAGVRLVRDLLREGMTLDACSGLVAELLNGEAR